MSKVFTTEERAKLTCAVLDRIFSSFGKWDGLARAAGARSTNSHCVYRLPESIRQNLYAHNWEGGLCVVIAEHYLPTLAPLSPDHASGALKVVQQDYFGWTREAILREREGQEHLDLVEALEQLLLEANGETDAG
jgi:hypothetical protein